MSWIDYITELFDGFNLEITVSDDEKVIISKRVQKSRDDEFNKFKYDIECTVLDAYNINFYNSEYRFGGYVYVAEIWPK